MSAARRARKKHSQVPVDADSYSLLILDMVTTIAECIEQQLLTAVFQPIGSLTSGEILGYEGLIRGPAVYALESPQALFELASREECMVRLERYAARVCIEAFVHARLPGKLFINYSAAAIKEIVNNESDARDFLESVGFPLWRVVIELTEQASPEPLSCLESAVRTIREAGAQFALDDFGQGNANLSLWIALQPDYVKIDRTVVDGVAKSAFRLEVLRYLRGLANAGNATLIAEGLENVEDLMVCRDIGIPYAQGYLLGKPLSAPSARLEDNALAAIHAKSRYFPRP
ncbi:EAL domain-containing protein [Cupriavidus numazuensis]|uniref:EAL domain-containing protein n=1 Tax=Cupriavidus numazuensis TaxID=221992 RepID=UPI001FD411B2|nr:EAL domain-containing protein [Cupriavidus numazuensis]